MSRYFPAIVVLAATLGGFTARPVVAAQNGSSAPPVRTVTADLNGDGTPEKISVTVTSPPQEIVRFTLTVGSAKYSDTALGDGETYSGLRIVKIDGSGKASQIEVDLTGEDDISEARFYRWDGQAIHPVGVVQNKTSLPGNGAVYAAIWMGFWTCTEKYAFDPATRHLTFVPQAAYYVGSSATVETTFPVLRDHAAGSAVVANTAPKSKIQVLLYWSPLQPRRGEDKGWYLIKTETGLCGWANISSFREKVEGLPYAG